MASQEINSTSWLANANLKAYYRFESGALTTDSSGESHTLTAISDPAEVAGKFGGGVDLDSGDAYSAANHADFNPTGSFSVGGWVKTTVDAQGIIFGNQTSVTNHAGYYLQGSSATTGLPQFFIARNNGGGAGVGYQTIIGGTATNDGAWHFVVGVWDGTNMNLYVDGKADAVPVPWYAPAYDTANQKVRVGCRMINGTTNINFITGQLDDVFLLNGTALTAEQVYGLYIGWNKYNGLTNLSVKTINGLAIASVKTVDGI